MLESISCGCGSGVAYQVSPVIGSQTVTSALYLRPNTPEFDPTLGAGNVRIVGSYQYVGSTQDNNGVLYTGGLACGGFSMWRRRTRGVQCRERE